MTGSQNRRQNVRASEGWDGGAIENRKEEQTRCTQVAERGEQTGAAPPSRRLDQQVQHVGNISSSASADFPNDCGLQFLPIGPRHEHFLAFESDRNRGASA